MASSRNLSRVLVGTAVLTLAGTAWAGSTWYRNNSDALALEGELGSVIGKAQGRESDAQVRDAARRHAGDLRSRMNALSERLFVDEERVKGLLVKIDWLEARLVHAEAVVAFERCRAEVAGYLAERESAVAACEGERSTHAGCLADFESERSQATATVGVGCALGAAAVAFFTGGLGAGALAMCAGATLAAHELPEDKCEEAPGCTTDRGQILATVLGSHGLSAMPVCVQPGPPPPSDPEEFIAWRARPSLLASR